MAGYSCHGDHSLTHCCAWPAEGRSVLHIERSWPAIQAASTDRPVSSSNCCSQFLRGRPGGRFQSAAGGVSVWASIDSCSACEAGVFSSRRQMWPNNEWRLSAIRGLVVSFSHWLLRWIPCHTIWYQGYDAVPACEKTGWGPCVPNLNFLQPSIYKPQKCTRHTDRRTDRLQCIVWPPIGRAAQ